MQLKVFYAWQSDHPEKLGKQFIRIALQEATERIRAARGLDIQIDYDTQGVVGTPPINDTILRKIDACHIFVGDMTFVAATDVGKQIPNPNVMAEYDYALKAKGWDRILLVMNTAFGPPENLPFDLHHHRHPASYALPAVKPDEARRAARAKFSEQLELGLNAMADDIIDKTPPPPNLIQPLEALAIDTLNARPSNNPPVLVSQPSAWLCLAPAAALGATTISLKAMEAGRHLLMLEDDVAALRGQDHTQWWVNGQGRPIPGLPNPEAEYFGRLLRQGIVEHVFTIGRRIDDDRDILVHGFNLEKRLVTLADRGLALLAQLGLPGPTLAAINLYGLDDVQLNGGMRIGRYRMPSLWLTPVLIPEAARQSGNFLRSAFDQMWLGAGLAEGSLSFGEDGVWKGYAPRSAC